MAEENTLQLREVSDGAIHHLWEAPAHKQPDGLPSQPYRLRLSVLANDLEHGDCPSQTFIFPSLHHLTHATNTLNLQFPSGEYETTKCGVETLGSEGERVEDGRTEMMVIRYDGQRVGGTWKAFLGRLRDAQVGWEVERGG